MKALGMIETLGMVGAIEAGDVAVKTANVEILNKHLTGNGMVAIEITGDIGAVNVAVDAAVEATKRMGVYLSSNIIARPSDNIQEILLKKEVKKEAKKEEVKGNDTKEIQNKKHKRKK